MFFGLFRVETVKFIDFPEKLDDLRHAVFCVLTVNREDHEAIPLIPTHEKTGVLEETKIFS